MKLTELAPLEFWRKLGEEVGEMTSLTAVTFDECRPLYPPESFANQLCATIKSNSSTSSAICGLAHQVICAMAKKKKRQ